jgi:hypothetical protein
MFRHRHAETDNLRRRTADQGFLWPYRTRPRKDETLSSWLSRLAAGNGLSLFTAARFLRIPMWDGDIDATAAKEWLPSICDATGTMPSEAWKTTLRSLDDVVLPNNVANALTWVLPLQRAPYKRRLHGFQICPECFTESDYCRLTWRLGFVTVCAKHEALLLDRCSWCRRPIRPRARTPSDVNHHVPPDCWSCRMPLRSSSAPISEELRSFQMLLESMALVECRPQERKAKREYFVRLRDVCNSIAPQIQRSRDRIELLTTAQRAELLTHAAHIL